MTLQDAFWAAADVVEIATTAVAIAAAIPSGGASVGAQAAATTAKTAAKAAAKTAMKAAAKSAVKTATKTGVKVAVKTGGKAVVKGSVRIAGKSSAKLAAKTSAKGLAKHSAKQTGKLALKNGGRAGAKATVARSGSVVRYKNIPKSNGSWLGKPGDSRWMPTPDRVGTKLNPTGKKMGQILAENNMQKGIPFKQGKIDLHAASKGTVRIDNYTLSRTRNFAQADSKLAGAIRSGKVNPDIQNALKSMGIDPKTVTKGDIKSLRKLGYTWHERPDMKTLDLIRSELHANVSHSGGISALKEQLSAAKTTTGVLR